MSNREVLLFLIVLVLAIIAVFANVDPIYWGSLAEALADGLEEVDFSTVDFSVDVDMD